MYATPSWKHMVAIGILLKWTGKLYKYINFMGYLSGPWVVNNILIDQATVSIQNIVGQHKGLS